MQTYGWDVVYACSGEYINRQLADSTDRLIHSFEYEDSAVKLSGEFGPWRIVPGGSGPLLQFETPITTGQIYVEQWQKSIPIEGVVPLVQMQLRLSDSDDQKRTLIFHCTTIGTKNGDTTPGAVTVIDPDTTGVLAKSLPPSEASIAAAVLATGLGAVLVRDADQLTFVFADQVPVPTGQNADWLTPVDATYAYQQPVDGTLGGLAILGMLTSTDTGDLPRAFDTALLADEDFGFVLAARPFLAHIVLPALPAAFKGDCRTTDFALDKDGGLVTKKGFHLNSVTVGLIDYRPHVKTAKYHIEDNVMRCYVATSTDITGLDDAYVTNSVTSRNESRFKVADRALEFRKDPHKSVTKDSHIPWWEEMVGGLTLDIMNVVVDAVSLAIENSVGDLTSAKTAHALGDIAPGLVSWSGQSSVTVKAGGLADNVYLQGALK